MPICNNTASSIGGIMRLLARSIALGYFVLIAVVVLLQWLGITNFRAPFQAIKHAPKSPIVISIAYSAEQRDWLNQALSAFQASNPNIKGQPIQVQLLERNSQALIANIPSLKPVAIIPTSSSQLQQLGPAVWANTAQGDFAPQATTVSPMVFMSWSDRSEKLFPPLTHSPWRRLHDTLILDNWGANTLGGEASWGKVKLGIVSPESDISGVNTLSLISYAYFNKSENLTTQNINDNMFQTWFGEFIKNVRDMPNSSETLANNFWQRGRSSYDVVFVYEHQALSFVARTGRASEISLTYPSHTFFADHPFTILEADWISSEQQQAARAFRDFLLSPDIQRNALQYGLRPVNPQISLDDPSPNNAFRFGETLGLQTEQPAMTQIPDPQISEAIMRLWRQQTRR
jgi:hypothetical protein